MIWTLFDYGVGNLHSLRKAIEAQGRAVVVTADPADLAGAEAILLPGVGAFGAVMEALAPAADALRAHHAAGRPLIGVCIGMQVMYERSEESPGVPGLGIVTGTVHRLPAQAGKVPHMGWNTVDVPDHIDPEHGTDALPRALSHAGHVYYVHSYAAPVTTDAIATSEYGVPFAAAIRKNRTVGFQFHPEKSSQAGARILGAALDLLEHPETA